MNGAIKRAPRAVCEVRSRKRTRRGEFLKHLETLGPEAHLALDKLQLETGAKLSKLFLRGEIEEKDTSLHAPFAPCACRTTNVREKDTSDVLGLPQI